MVYEPSPKTSMPADTAVQCTSRKSLGTVCNCMHASLRACVMRGLFGWRGLMDC